ncbi:MAG: hypothetical protein ACLSA2_04410 [Candidatus Gastranaerophilaceae bacterium]
MKRFDLLGGGNRLAPVLMVSPWRSLVTLGIIGVVSAMTVLL